MAFKFEVTGMDELLQRMDRAPKKAAKVGSEALFEGAGVVADSVSGAVHGIRLRRRRPSSKAPGTESPNFRTAA